MRVKVTLIVEINLKFKVTNLCHKQARQSRSRCDRKWWSRSSSRSVMTDPQDPLACGFRWLRRSKGRKSRFEQIERSSVAPGSASDCSRGEWANGALGTWPPGGHTMQPRLFQVRVGQPRVGCNSFTEFWLKQSVLINVVYCILSSVTFWPRRRGHIICERATCL